jgi:Rrf2 family transcriptional regulator, cysteine metabolism repressor
MLVSQKAQYALRGVFELARQYGKGWVRISDIADAQAIPIRFLEVILSQVKQAGFIVSRRGAEGGYMLTVNPRDLTVGQVLNFIQGPVGPVECVTEEANTNKKCPLFGGCAFIGLWEKVQKAISDVYDHVTFQDLIDEDIAKRQHFVPSYSI